MKEIVASSNGKYRPGMANENQITCQEFVEMVTDYLEQVLIPETRKQFEEHAESCPGCEMYLQQVQQTIGMLRRVADEPVTPDTKQKLLQAFGQWKQEHNQLPTD
jgi:predicted anti-sigma-YlaC factor YlaD